MSHGVPKRLPARQKELMIAVLAYMEEHGVVPTNRYLVSALGLKGNTSVTDFLRSLALRGVILRRPQHLSRRRASPAKNQHPANTVNCRPALNACLEAA